VGVIGNRSSSQAENHHFKIPVPPGCKLRGGDMIVCPLKPTTINDTLVPDETNGPIDPKMLLPPFPEFIDNDF